MGFQTQLDQAPQMSRAPHWNLAQRVSFRFCFVYLGLFCIFSEVLGGLVRLPNFFFPPVATMWPMRQIVLWTGAHIFRVAHPLVYADFDSGDKTFDWITVFCLLIFAVVATMIWSVLDRRRENYVTLDKWFRLFVRFALAGEMFTYGIDKVIPLQMPFPFLTRFVEPFGNFTPLGVLWNSIGASPAFEIFTGCAETLGGILLLVPRTTMLGTLLCLADLTEVFILNMTYDVPVKLLSFHLLLMALFLLAPEVPRLINLFLLNRSVDASTQPQLFSTHRANRLATTVQIAFGIYLIAVLLYGEGATWYAFGGGRTKSPLYGIWNVEQLVMDGQLHPPLLTDNSRWRRLIFDFPTSVNFQGVDDSFTGYSASIDVKEKTIALTKAGDKNWKALFSFERPKQNELILDGQMDNHTIHMQLQLTNLEKYQLVNRPFHWIADYAYDREEVWH
jgi:hypothetical protein